MVRNHHHVIKKYCYQAVGILQPENFYITVLPHYLRFVDFNLYVIDFNTILIQRDNRFGGKFEDEDFSDLTTESVKQNPS